MVVNSSTRGIYKITELEVHVQLWTLQCLNNNTNVLRELHLVDKHDEFAHAHLPVINLLYLHAKTKNKRYLFFNAICQLLLLDFTLLQLVSSKRQFTLQRRNETEFVSWRIVFSLVYSVIPYCD